MRRLDPGVQLAAAALVGSLALSGCSLVPGAGRATPAPSPASPTSPATTPVASPRTPGGSPTPTPVVGSPTPATSSASPGTPETNTLAASLRAYADSRPVPVGIAVLPVGGELIEAGKWRTGVAWSTSKVPLVMASQRHRPPGAESLQRQAITVSDNAAALALWNGLGTPRQAADAMDAVASRYGVRLGTQAQTVRAGYTPFGQTHWSTADQARFMAGLTCDPSGRQTLALMGSISSDHRWGLGRIPQARFKGGWGPEPSGESLERQLGVVDLGRGPVAVAIAARATDPWAARRELDQLAAWLTQHAPSVPPGRCR